MATYVELEMAVDIGDRCYRLLRWMEGGVRTGFISLESAGQYITEPDAAEAWLVRHFADIPPEARPRSTGPQDLRPFVRYFTTYLKTSFDLHEAPGRRFVTECCTRCGEWIDRPHLQPKRITRRDRSAAQCLKRRFLEERLTTQGVPVDDSLIESLISELSREVALASYGRELLRRLEGSTSGPATLALWREFAWKPEGSPIKGFALSATDIEEAHQKIDETIKTHGRFN